MTSITSGVFSDFCQAWVARFPGSELPAAWEEDVRANLKKHKTKVAILREELEKEEMYVEYLDKLLVDIEQHRKLSTTSSSTNNYTNNTTDTNSNQMASSNYHTLEEIERLTTCREEQNKGVIQEEMERKMNDENKRRSNPFEAQTSTDKQSSCDDSVKSMETTENSGSKPELRLDLQSAINLNDITTSEEAETARADDVFEPSTFVTVINVPSASSKENKSDEQQEDSTSNLKYAENNNKEIQSKDGSRSNEQRSKKAPQPPKRNNTGSLARSRESLNSISSPIQTPVDSPLISPSSTEDFVTYPREALASTCHTAEASNISTFNSSISSSTTASSSHSESTESRKKGEQMRYESKPPSTVPQTSAESLKRSHPVTKRSLTVDALTTRNMHSTFEKRRGQPDGRDVEEAEDNLGRVCTGRRKISEPTGSAIDDTTADIDDVTGLPKYRGVKNLMANWEKVPANDTKSSTPENEEITELNSGHQKFSAAQRMPATRKDSDSSGSRGRMGSPSGKSHDSSDSETPPISSWGQGASTGRGSSSPSARRRISGETRLDRLVRRPSSENKSQVPPVPPPLSGIPKSSHLSKQQMPRAKPRNISRERIIENRARLQPSQRPTLDLDEPLYDTVANDDPICQDDEYYDNHLLYSTQTSLSGGKSDKTGTIGSGGGSSADLGFDEPPIMHHAQLPPMRKAQSGLSIDRGTLSSTGSTESPSCLRREMSIDDPESNYVNIQYFYLKRNLTHGSRDSIDNIDDEPHEGLIDDEVDGFDVRGHSACQPDQARHISNSSSRSGLSHKYLSKANSGSKSVDPMAPSSTPPALPPQRMSMPVMQRTESSQLSEERNSSEAERIFMYKCILTSILESEAIYLEGLSVMLQYMKAMKVTLTTPNPIIPKEDLDIIFHKVPELHDLHFTFYESLKRQVDRWTSSGGERDGGDGITVGHPFKMLASRTKIYAAFLNNYQQALDSLHRCTVAYPQFSELTKSIKLRTLKGMQKQGQSLSLEDLLHKPVARVQKNCLCLQDLIKYTPRNHPDNVALTEALGIVQNFVNEYNMVQSNHLFRPGAGEKHGDERPNLRHLVKNSFIVELSEGQRKLRHLFLFNDVLVCAKYKPGTGKHEKFTFQLKWFIPLCHALIVEEPSTEPKESNPANLVSLKTQAASLRDQIYRIEKEEEMKGEGKSSAGGSRRHSNSTSSGGSGGGSAVNQPSFHHSKASRKFRDKLAEIEAQIVLAAPELLFQVTHKVTGKLFTFCLSSEYERSEWLKSLQGIQKTMPPDPVMLNTHAKSMSMGSLQGYLTKYRQHLQTNMGSFLMRSPRDEPLLVGDLVFRVDRLQGLTRPCDLYVVIEVDSYGHYFRKSKTKTVTQTMEPSWDEEFMIELEGSENMRILVYEMITPPPNSYNTGLGNSPGAQLRGRATLDLSRTWLTNKMSEQRISMNDVVLTCSMKYLTFEDTMRRVPTNKATGLFGTPISITCRKEKRAVPFIVTSCVREVERRGISEIGIYRVSGSTPDVQRLKRAYESNPYEAEQLLKECDIHSVAGTLKLYLRDLPESLFTSQIYQQLFEAYSSGTGGGNSNDIALESRKHAYLNLFSQIPQNPNQACIVFLIEHMVRVSQLEQTNKMSLHNLATVFGPTMLHAGGGRDAANMTIGTVDVMAQAGILYFFLTRRARGEPIQLQIVERQV